MNRIQRTAWYRTALPLIAALALAACGESQDSTKMQRPPTEVGVYEVQPQSLPVTIELPGRTSAHVFAEIRPQVGGIIQKRLFEEGQDIKAGQALYQIDPASYRAAHDSAAAALAKAEANVLSARLKSQRYDELAQIEAVSQQDKDDALSTLKQAEADVGTARAALETARINLAYTRISSPIAGRIATSAVTPGALVTADQSTVLTTVQQLDPIYVDLTQPATEVLRLKRELSSGRIKRLDANRAKVRLVLDDGSAYSREGSLEFVGVSASESTGAVTLRAVVPNPDGDLMPGMYVRAVLEAGVNEQALLVPQQGITRDSNGNATALVVTADGKVEQRAIKTAQAVGDRWVVTDGLSAGERVIVEGTQKTKPGAVVRAVKANLPAAGSLTADR